MDGLQANESRTITCAKCGKTEKERVFGDGFVGWIALREIFQDIIRTEKMFNPMTKALEDVPRKARIFPELCPDCVKKLIEFLSHE